VPVIAAYLRSLNDIVDGRRRQDLYPYASAAVGTNRGAALELRRLNRCRQELESLDAGCSWLRRVLSQCAVLPSPFESALALERFATQLVRALRRTSADWHERALALADELIAMTPEESPAAARGAERDEDLGLSRRTPGLTVRLASRGGAPEPAP
jgi:hypothetical protein